MANVIRFKRRWGSSGAPSALKSGEPAYNGTDDVLYIGFGDDGSGNATSIKPISGAGNFVDLSTNQTIGGTKTFTGDVNVLSSLSVAGKPVAFQSATVTGDWNSWFTANSLMSQSESNAAANQPASLAVNWVGLLLPQTNSNNVAQIGVSLSTTIPRIYYRARAAGSNSPWARVYDSISMPLASGTYTPTLTGVANVASTTVQAANYLRVGDTVTVSGRITVTPSAGANTLTSIGLSLPIASDIAANENCAGSGSAQQTPYAAVSVVGDATNNRAQLQFMSNATASIPLYYQFTYTIL